MSKEHDPVHTSPSVHPSAFETGLPTDKDSDVIDSTKHRWMKIGQMIDDLNRFVDKSKKSLKFTPDEMLSAYDLGSSIFSELQLLNEKNFHYPNTSIYPPYLLTGASATATLPSTMPYATAGDVGGLSSLGDLATAGLQQPMYAPPFVVPTHSGATDLICTKCGTRSTPQWRRGPAGPKTLCNACGIVYSKKLRRERQSQEKKVASPPTGSYT